MAQACPINFTRADATIGRICSLISTSLVVLFAATGMIGILFFLFADLLTRLYVQTSYSPMYQTAVRIKRWLKLPSHPVDGAVKHIVGHFGLAFLLMLISAWALQATTVLYVIAAVYAACMLVDGVTGYCVGCTVYHAFCRLTRR